MTRTKETTYGVKEIAKLFPSLMKIKRKSLREKVAAVWNEAITTGCGGKGWTFAELRAVKFTLLAGDIDMKFVEHLNSCALQCIAIADVLKRAFRSNIPIQRDYLIAGALLADAGKPPLDRVDHFPSRRLRGLRHRQVSGQARREEIILIR